MLWIWIYWAKEILAIRKPSGTHVHEFKQHLISSKLKTLISDIIYEKKFNENDYQHLDDEEKKIFDDLLTLSKLDTSDSLKLYNHRKYNSDEIDRDVKRFNILRGEILAGNDSKEVVKEIKALLFKLLNEKVISQRDYTSLVYRLLLLD